jgi:hypothetical protein
MDASTNGYGASRAPYLKPNLSVIDSTQFAPFSEVAQPVAPPWLATLKPAPAANVITWTESPDKSGSTMTQYQGTPDQFVERLRTIGTFSSKDKCPLIKMAGFGTHRTEKGSLRNNENVISISGIEGDYDGEVVSLELAREMLQRAGIAALLYPSPSSTPEKPRWRVLCLLSAPRNPDDRATLVGWLNGVLGGILTTESFTLSQGFYFGATPTNDYRVLTTEGGYIDEMQHLDSKAIGKPGKVKKEATSKPDKARTDQRIYVDLEPDERQAILIENILTGAEFHTSLRDLAASMVATGMQPGAVVNHLRGLMDTSTGAHDDRWQARRNRIPRLVDSASLKFSPLDFPDLVAVAQSAPEPRYKLRGRDYLASLPPLVWRIHGVLPSEGLAGLYGPSASGKSFLGFDMAAAVAEGVRWFGCRVQAAPVVYVVLEGESGTKQRVTAWELHHSRPLPAGLHMVLQPFGLGEIQDVADLAAVVPPGAVVFIDTLNRAAPTADENSSKDMGKILSAAKQLQAATNGLVVLIHHTGKDATKGMRGHSSLLAALDAAVEVSRDGDRRGWQVVKAKDGRDGDAHPFKLKVISMGVDSFGDEITSCVVEPDHAIRGVSAVKVPQGGNQKLVLDALRPLFQACVPGDGLDLEVAVTAGAARLTCASDKRTTRSREAITGLVARGVLELNDSRLSLK